MRRPPWDRARGISAPRSEAIVHEPTPAFFADFAFIDRMDQFI